VRVRGGGFQPEDVGWLSPRTASDRFGEPFRRLGCYARSVGREEEFEMADAGKPVTVQYFYKIRWGFQDEFLALFERNHWPLLKAQLESGRLLAVKAFEPRFHGDGRQDWTFEVTITYRDWASMEEHTDPAIVRRLYPDAEKLAREEQRRFELVEAHWDTPLEERALPR
jgi:hypothetical protein